MCTNARPTSRQLWIVRQLHFGTKHYANNSTGTTLSWTPPWTSDMIVMVVRYLQSSLNIIPGPGTMLSTAAQTIVVPGQPMPYIHLPDDQRPSVSATVELHQLSSEQEFAFRLIMDTMQKHLAKEIDIPQLTMSVLGNAGKYIHRIIKLFWYACIQINVTN